MDKLPFDVLGVIFYHYRLKETIAYPLETLLLVSKLWNETALGHRHIWGRLSIYIGHLPDSDIWIYRLPRRLERAGDYTPLEIDLRSRFETFDPSEHVDRQDGSCKYKLPPFYYYCSCAPRARYTVLNLLRTLAGPKGVLCQRWKSLRLCLGPDAVLSNELRYPTPILTMLHIERSLGSSEVVMLPSAPSLQFYRLEYWLRFMFPDLNTVQDLCLELYPHSHYSPSDLSNLTTANNIKNLKISRKLPSYSSSTYSFRSILAYLHSMTLIGDDLPANLCIIHAPKLRALSLKLDDLRSYQLAVNSNLLFGELSELCIAWPSEITGRYEELIALTRKLLPSCNNLTRVHGDKRSLPVMIKILWEKVEAVGHPEDWTSGRVIRFYRTDQDMELRNKGLRFKGVGGSYTLEDIAFRLEIQSPTVSWKHMQMLFEIPKEQ